MFIYKKIEIYNIINIIHIIYNIIMDLYITFNKESGFYETINNCEIEYIISIENKNISTIKFTECIDGQICNTSVYSLNYDNHTSKITVPLNTLNYIS